MEQSVYRVSKDHKRHLLAHLINDGNWHQVLVFTRTKHGANRLAQQLEGSGIRAAAIHGNKSQSARVRALADFKANKVIALVATEVAARGLDIKELPQVVNYELPNVPEDYVHRIGRTARAGGTGRAVSLVSPDEGPLLRDIERVLRRSVPVAALPQFEIVNAPVRPGAPADGNGAGGDARHAEGGARPDSRPRSYSHGRRSSRGGGQRGNGHSGQHRSGGGQRGQSHPGQHRSDGGQRGNGHPGQQRSEGGQRGQGHGQPHDGQRRNGAARPGSARPAGGRERGARPSRDRSGPSRMY